MSISRGSLVAAVEAERGDATGASLVDFAFHLSFGTPPSSGSGSSPTSSSAE